MSNSNNKLLPFLIVSLVIHSIIILLISNRDNHASIKILQRKPIIINLASSAPQSSQKEIEQSIKETKKAPHMLVVMVYQSPTDMDLAIEGGGELTMFMISTDVETVGKRSLIRGESSGRFEATTTILNTHKAVASQFNDRLKHFTEGKEKPKI